MHSKLVYENEGLRTFVVILDGGDEVMACLRQVAEEQNLSGAQITAIGAFSDAVITYFDWERKEYLPNRVDEQVEVASLVGDIALSDGEPTVHVHLVLGRRDGSALAGHLGEAHVRPTLEIIITETPAHLRKQKDPETGLALIRL